MSLEKKSDKVPTIVVINYVLLRHHHPSHQSPSGFLLLFRFVFFASSSGKWRSKVFRNRTFPNNHTYSGGVSEHHPRLDGGGRGTFSYVRTTRGSSVVRRGRREGAGRSGRAQITGDSTMLLLSIHVLGATATLWRGADLREDLGPVFVVRDVRIRVGPSRRPRGTRGGVPRIASRSSQ